MNFFILSFKRKDNFLVAWYFLLFLLFGLTLFITIGLIGKHIAPVATLNHFGKSIEESKFNLNDAEIITLGTSHNRAILANEIKTPLVHLFSGGQNLKESLYILNYFKKRLKKIKFILLPITIGSLEQKTKLRSSLTKGIISLDPFIFFKYKTLDDLSLYLGGIFNLIARDDNWIPVIQKIIPINFKEKQYTNPILVDAALGHHKRIDISNKQHAENINYLKNISILANDSGSCLVLYDSPVSSNYLENFKKYKPKLSKWRVPIRDFVQQNKDKLCIYFFEKIWSKSNSKNLLYYRDQHHLNDTGAKIFTSLMDKELKKIENKYGKH
jgi:hypothetical protein